MKIIIELLVALACVYAVFVQLLRIIWLQFPDFLKQTKLYYAKEPKKLEMLLYYLLALTALLYNIFLTIERHF